MIAKRQRASRCGGCQGCTDDVSILISYGSGMTPEEKAGRGLGPTGETVRERIKEIRGRMPLTELSEKLTALGRPIPVIGLRRIESGDRRVDVDDLVALAQALGVSPITFMTPNAQTDDEAVTVTGVGHEITARHLWRWLRAERPLPGENDLTGLRLLEFAEAALPIWRAVQYGEGVLELMKLNELESKLSDGGPDAEDAKRQIDLLAKKFGLGQHGDD